MSSEGFVWYHPERDLIFMNSYVDAMYYRLSSNIMWNEIVLIGEL